MSAKSDTITILHVEDDSWFADLTATVLRREHDQFEIETAHSAADGFDRLADIDVDCIVSDYDMPGQTGIEFLETVREDHPELPFILFTGKGSEDVASDAISAGVTDYLQKESGTDQYTVLANRIQNAVSAHRMTAEVEQTQQQLEQILKTVPACIVQLNYDGEFIYANERAVEVLGLEQSAVTKRTYSDPEWKIRDLHGEPIPEDDLPFRQVRDSGEPLYGYRHSIEWPDGTRKVLLVNGAPLFDDDENVRNVIFALSDITDKWEQQTRLQQATARLNALFERSPDMINVHDSDGTIVDVNPRLCEETGYDEDDLVGMNVWDIDIAIGRKKARALWAEMDVDERREIEGIFRRRDGSTFPAKVHIRRINLDGTDRFVVISRNITDRKERERELEIKNRRLEAILNNTTTPMFMKDDDGRYIFVNHGYRELFDLRDDTVVGKTDHDLYPPEVAEELWQNDRVVMESEEPLETEERIIANGEERRFLSTKVPIYDTGEHSNPDTPVAVFGIATEITELRRREDQLQRERDRLEEFASIVSHDLRNPLSVAKGNLELAREEHDSEYLDAVARAHERIDVLVADVLALAREGEQVADTESVDLDGLVESCWQNVETAEATLVAKADRTIRADRSRLTQLLENLFRNAVEHGGEDVAITVGAVEDGFYVADDGPGIPAAEREQIFESGYTTSADGTAFGLAVVQAIVEAHGWTVRATESGTGGARVEIIGIESIE